MGSSLHISFPLGLRRPIGTAMVCNTVRTVIIEPTFIITFLLGISVAFGDRVYFVIFCMVRRCAVRMVFLVTDYSPCRVKYKACLLQVVGVNVAHQHFTSIIVIRRLSEGPILQHSYPSVIHCCQRTFILIDVNTIFCYIGLFLLTLPAHGQM